MKSEWSDKLRNRLEHHKMDAPAGLWEDISQKMARTHQTRQQRTMFFTRAAAIAIIVLASALFLHYYSGKGFYSVKKEYFRANNLKGRKIEESLTGAEKKEEKRSETTAEHVLLAKTSSHLNEEPKNVSPEKNHYPTPSNGSEEDKEHNQQVSPTNENTEEPTKTPSSPTIHIPTTEQLRHPHLKREKGRWTISMDASSGLLASNEKYDNSWYSNVQYLNPTLLMLEAKKLYQAPQNEEQVNKTHHRFPLRFGVKFSYLFQPRWSIDGGLRYTQLSSEAIEGNGQWMTERHLRINYLGVSLGLSYQLWSVSHFSIYANGGIALDAYISGQENLKNYQNGTLNYSMKSHLQQKPLQFSVNASVGAQYQIGKTICIFAEPSVGYYFDDGTTIQHYFKKHPLAPTVNLGVKFKLHQNEP